MTATDVPNLTSTSTLQNIFRGATSLIGNSSFNSWNTSGITNMAGMLWGASSFNQPIGNWGTGQDTAKLADSGDNLIIVTISSGVACMFSASSWLIRKKFR